ncbi:MAG: serine/threonine-protein kinase [Rhodothermales bacterium]
MLPPACRNALALRRLLAPVTVMLETNEKPSFSRYTISSTLGTGGMGTVYRAHHEILDRPVALKVPKEEFTRDQIFVERFMREAKALGTLKHPHVVSVYDAGIEHGVPFIAMECVEGKTLAEIIRDGGVLPIEDIVRWGWQMADALAYVNKRGVLHRDLKSANVIINRAGAAVITDFGIARLEESSTQITRGMIGTPAYMSPEQARGQPIDARSDLYSLGIILYECLTGELPFADENALALIQKVINEAPPSLMRRRPDTPSWLRAVVYRCLEKKPARRYKSGQEMAEALRPFVSAEPSRLREETAMTVWSQPADTLVSPPHREAARHFTLAVANLARAIQLSGGKVRTSLHDGMTRTWHTFQQRTEMLPEPLPAPEHVTVVDEPVASRFAFGYRSIAVVLLLCLSFTALWGAVIAPGMKAADEVDTWGVYVSPVRPEAAYTPLPPQELSAGPGFVDDTPAEPEPATTPAPAVAGKPDTKNVSSSAARRRELIEQSRPVQINPLEPEPVNPGVAAVEAPAAPTRFAVLPSSIWTLKEQATPRAFERQLRSLLKNKQVAVLDPNDVEAPDAAYVFLVDQAGGSIPHMLAWRDQAWTDLKTGEGFVLTEYGFLPQSAAADTVGLGLEAYWVEHALNGVTQNKKRVGW